MSTLQSPPNFTWYDRAPRAFRLLDFEPRVDDLVVRIVNSWRVRFRCCHCNHVFTEYPSFALPHKRFVRHVVLQKARHFLASRDSYQQTVRGKRLPHGYLVDPPPVHEPVSEPAGTIEPPVAAVEPPAGTVELPSDKMLGRHLRPSTVWRWLSWLGGLSQTLARVLQLVLEQNPQSDLYRRDHHLEPRKYRSETRRDRLLQAARMLNAVQSYADAFGFPGKIFTHFAISSPDG